FETVAERPPQPPTQRHAATSSTTDAAARSDLLNHRCRGTERTPQPPGAPRRDLRDHRRNGPDRPPRPSGGMPARKHERSYYRRTHPWAGGRLSRNHLGVTLARSGPTRPRSSVGRSNLVEVDAMTHGDSLSLTVEATQRSLEERLGEALLPHHDSTRPRDHYAATDTFLAATSRHLAAIEGVLLHPVRHSVPDG